MPFSSGPSPRLARSRLDPPSPSSPIPPPAAPAPPSPGRIVFFLHAPPSGTTSSRVRATHHVHEPLTIPVLRIVRRALIRAAPTTRATYHRPPRGSIVSASGHP